MIAMHRNKGHWLSETKVLFRNLPCLWSTNNDDGDNDGDDDDDDDDGDPQHLDIWHLPPMSALSVAHQRWNAT